MATYTDNYNLIKPTYAETADIVPLNNNFEKIDEVMHASQTSLAPAYDQTASYQPGDVVMYELNMYKCTGATSGTWDPSKWTRTTAAETGGGGGADLDIYGEASGTAEASFSDGAEASLVKCIVEIEATQSGSGTPSPSNVRPIVGRSEVKVSVSGKNKCPITTMSTTNGGYINLSTGIIGSVVAGQTYTFSLKNETPITANLVVRMLVNGSWVKLTEGNLVAYEVKTYTFTPTNNGDVSLSAGLGVDYSPAFSKLQLELGSTATAYEPYITPEETTIPLDRTVYGGTLDVTTGELTVTKADVNLSQQNLSYNKFTTGTSDRFYVRLSNYITNVMIDGFNDIESDYFDAKMQSTNEVGTVYMENGYLNMNMTQGQFADATAFKTWIESESVHLVYELATPQTFNLTPTQVETLLGQNYVSHDGGGTISLVYIKGDAPIKPNPADAEIPLTGLEIDGKKFSIPQSGAYEEVVLYENSYLTANPSILPLAEDFREYDEIVFWLTKRDDSSYYDYLPTQSIPCEMILDAMNGAMSGRPNVLNISGWQPMSQFLRISVSAINQFTIVVNNNNFLIRKITGIKH